MVGGPHARTRLLDPAALAVPQGPLDDSRHSMPPATIIRYRELTATGGGGVQNIVPRISF
jgi:hypothetical protein